MPPPQMLPQKEQGILKMYFLLLLRGEVYLDLYFIISWQVILCSSQKID